MTRFPLTAALSLDECGQLVDEADQSYSEYVAEVGSSAFMLYGNSADAMTVAYAEVRPPSETDPVYREARQRIREAERRVAHARNVRDASAAPGAFSSDDIPF